MVHNGMPSSRAGRAVASASVIRGKHVVVVCVAGEVDVVSAPAIVRVARRACWSTPAILIVDLTEVIFFGAAGLTLLVDVHRQTQLAGTTLYLVAPSWVARLLRITGLDQVFAAHDPAHHAGRQVSPTVLESPSDDTGQRLAPPTLSSAVDDRRPLLRLVSG